MPRRKSELSPLIVLPAVLRARHALGREQMRMDSGPSQSFVATKCADGTWNVEQGSPGPFASLLTQDQAQALVAQLARLHKSTRVPARRDRAACPSCGRDVAITKHGLAWHDLPGGERKPCKGSGAGVQHGR